MIDYDSLDEFRDPETYDLIDAGYYDDRPVIEEWARALGGPVLDVACGTGRMAIPLAAQGYEVTGVDIVPEMIARARRKAAEHGVSVEWVVADGRGFQVDQRFAFAYMVENAFQFFHTREDQEALLSRVREHVQPEGCFLFETRNPSPRNLYEPRRSEPQRFTTPDGGQLTTEDEPPRYDPLTQIQHCTTHYRWLLPNGKRVDTTKRTALRYVFPQEIEALLHYNGFAVRARYGTWQQDPLNAASPEMIFVCQPRA